MNDFTDDSAARVEERRHRSRRAPLLLATGMVALALGSLWVMRAPLAENLIERELAARHVRMDYRIASIGLRTQRIEDIVLGDPARPDLTARWVEVDVSFAGLTPGVAAVRAGGVRLRGALHDGTLTLGELDKFMGQGHTTEGALPDIRVGLEDARASLDTDYGPLGLALDGSGYVRDGFNGRAALAMPWARVGDCALDTPRATLSIAMRHGEPHLRGPIQARRLSCRANDIALASPVAHIDATLDKALASLSVRADISAPAARAAGAALTLLKGSATLKGDKAGFEGRGRLGSEALGTARFAAGASDLSFRFTGSLPRNGAVKADVDGTLALRNVALTGREPLAGLGGATAGTPFAPLAARLAGAVRDAGRGNRFETGLSFLTDEGATEASLSDLHFAADSGARVDLASGGRAAMRWPDRQWSLSGALTMGGGGLPEGALSLAPGAGGGLSGLLRLRPYAAGDARLALAPVRFSAAPDGTTRFVTTATLDGPLADGGGVKGLTVPLKGAVSGKGAFALNADCSSVRWQALRISTLALDGAAVDLCPVEGGAMLRYAGGRVTGGARTANIVLGGRIGSSPLRLTASQLAFALSRSNITAGNLEARIGREDAPVILGARSLEGAMGKGGMEGRFADGHGLIGAVPLRLSQMDGRWRFAGGRLDVDGDLHVSDTATAARFNPVLARGAHLTLADGRISATGNLRHPTRGPAFAKVDITHDLSAGTGEARIAVDRLRFGNDLQPDDLTPLAHGVVANVSGDVAGNGRIRWTPSGVTSSGRFGTAAMDLAAAFGPVQGLATTLTFTDLLALETAPGQVATVKSINPGVDVHDGTIRYQLVRDARARIEGGEWPFAGGRLALLPSTMDFDAKGARNLIFRVTGLDAGAFINTMELKNISATGTYDGLLPMIFDASGGRIAGGILVARQEGMPPLVVENAQNLTVSCDPVRQAGTLSYVGDVSNANMGTYGKMAFDALKRLRYRCLTILLDGALDGEFVTRIAINGINQGTDESRRSFIARKFLGIPFLFNVRIEAPFRGLLNTYQSFVDPSALVKANLGPQYRTVLENRLAVQPADSEKGVTRERE